MQSADRRLVKLLAVALSTTESGEAFAALQAVKRVLTAQKKDVRWLLDNLVRAPAPATPFVFSTNFTKVSHDDMVTYLGDDLSMMMLSVAEMDFVMDMAKRFARYKEFKPTQRQGAWLTKIYNRVKTFRDLNPV